MYVLSCLDVCMCVCGPTGKGKSWHPGVKGHKLRADSFSYFLTSILSSSLTDVSNFTTDGLGGMFCLRPVALSTGGMLDKTCC